MKTLLHKVTACLVIVLLSMPACTPPSHTTTVACYVADLIKAIETANADVTPDILELDPACSYVLTEVYTTISGTFEESTFEYGEVGLPPISTPITINGHEAIISRSEAAPDFRIFHIQDTGNLTLNDLTISNGFADALTEEGTYSAFPGSGGGIYNAGGLLQVNRSSLLSNRAGYYGGAIFDIYPATTHIYDSTIRDNTAAHGGGIFEYQSTLLSVEGSTITHNTAETEGGGINVAYGSELVIRSSVISFNHSARRGGGLFKDGSAERKPTTISGSTFEGNTADWGGGAVFIWRTPLTVGDSTFRKNQAGEYGGALGYQNDSNETVLVRSSTFEENTAGLDGGAIHFSGELMRIAASTFGHNTAQNGGAIHNAAAELDHYIQRPATNMQIDYSTIEENEAHVSGGGIYNGGSLTVDASSIGGNTSISLGGGVHNLGMITIRDSTFKSNRTGLDGGGLSTYGLAALTGSTFLGNSSARGAGLASVGGTVALINDTFSNNVASERGGAIFNMAGAGKGPELGLLRASFVTVAFNSAPAGGGIFTNSGRLRIKNSIVARNPSGGDCSTSGGDFVALSENLDSDNSCPGFTIHADPLLNVLADYGGPTWTHALQDGSPAINAAPGCTTVAGAAVSVDQRGRPRPVGPFCDLGAFELEKILPAPATKEPMFIVTVTAEPPTLTAIQNANCRYGPGTAYDIADTLFAGQTAPIVGRNQQSTWWQIKGPAFGTLCWVSAVTVKVSGPTENVPVGVAPPPPTLTPAPHKPQNKPQGCYVYDASGNRVCTVPCPPGAQPGGACTP